MNHRVSTDGLRAVVLSAERRAFCAGLDMESFRGMSGKGGTSVNTRGLAARTHGKSPLAVRAAKRLLNRACTSDPEAGLIAEAKEQEALIGSANQVEAIRSNLDKRGPSFADVRAS
jgi:enoyl-CoA hydratase/carnithine racemase